MVLVPLLVAAVATTLAVAPLPASLVRFANGEVAEARCAVWQALGDGCDWMPLAVDRGITTLEAVRLWLVLVLGLVVSSRAQSGASVSGLWAIMALCGAAHFAFVSTTQSALGPRFGAFVSDNHQAAFFNLAWACSLASAWMMRGWRRRGFIVLTLALLAGALLTLSRGGIVAALLGLVAYGILLSREWSRGAITRTLIAITGLLAMVYALMPRFLPVFAVANPLEKLDIYAPTFDLIRRHPFGVGRGGFVWAFNMVRPAQRFWLQHDYVENEYLQAFADYGWLGGVVACFALLLVVIRVLRLSLPRADGLFDPHRPKAVATFVVLLMLAVHNMVDFNWEVLGIYAPTWCLLAALGRPGEAFFSPSGFKRSRLTSLRVALFALLVAVPMMVHALRVDARRLEATPTQAHLARLVAERPTDAAALVALGRLDTAHTIAWLNRAMAADPMYGNAYLASAEWLCARKAPAQAFGEVRRALMVEPNLGNRSAALVRECFNNHGAVPDKVWLSLLGPEYDFRPVLFALQYAPATAQSMLAKDYIDYAPTKNALVLAELARRQRGTPLWDEVMAAWGKEPQLAASLRDAERAEVMWLSGDRDQALRRYRELAQAGGSTALRARLVELLWQAGRADEADQVNQSLQRDCEHEPHFCRAYRENRARFALHQGRKPDALFEYRMILLKNPGDVSAAVAAAQILSEQGDNRTALEVLARADPQQREPRVQQLRERLNEQRSDSDRLIERLMQQR